MRLSLRFIVPLLIALARVRVRGRAARRRADAALVRARPRHPLQPHRHRRCRSRSIELIATGSTPRITQLLQPHAAGRAPVRGRAVPRRRGRRPIATAQLPARALDCAALETYDGSRARCCARPGACCTSRCAASTPTTARQALARARPRHELHRAPQRGDAALPLLFLRRARRVRRAHHGGHRAALVARLGARACARCCAARASCGRRRRPPRRSCGRSRATCAS